MRPVLVLSPLLSLCRRSSSSTRIPLRSLSWTGSYYFPLHSPAGGSRSCWRNWVSPAMWNMLTSSSGNISGHLISDSLPLWAMLILSHHSNLFSRPRCRCWWRWKGDLWLGTIYLTISSPFKHQPGLPACFHPEDGRTKSRNSTRSWRRSILESSLTASPSTLSRPSSWGSLSVKNNSSRRWGLVSPGEKSEDLFMFQSTEYILTRGEKLAEAARLIEPENQDIAAQLRWRQGRRDRLTIQFPPGTFLRNTRRT